MPTRIVRAPAHPSIDIGRVRVQTSGQRQPALSRAVIAETNAAIKGGMEATISTALTQG
jgi:hypothetical protein